MKFFGISVTSLIFSSEGSGRVSGLAWSTGLVQLDDNVTEVQIGSPVKFLPYEFLQQISNEIINNVKGINRVVYDISSKPPATIEWE